MHIDTHYLFDGMPRRGKTAKESTGSFEDRLSALPDDLLHHTLGFLEAREAVRTCVLSRRWRHLWRPIPRLRITNIDAFRSVEKLNEFVCKLFMLRDAGSVLDECELDLRGFLQLDDLWVHLWIRRVLACRARVLRLDIYTNLPTSSEEPLVQLANLPLLSHHLVRLELHGVFLKEGFLDFSSCPVLEDLKIADCVLHTVKILSQSSKHMSIMGCQFLWDMRPPRISAPSLVSLQLHGSNMIPVLESMPFLETASVNLCQKYEEFCDFCDGGSLEAEKCDCGMSELYWDNGRKRGFSVFLEGLSSATCLELIASPEMIIFTRDLQCCPPFSKLRSLFLNDWCLVFDLQILLFFLHHTPVLEKLTLQLCKGVL
ncbi:MEIOTIC F-BOX protein MOF isoform X2 [Lolium perenne]|uniref:MEIOTIC F-BOX protein MOF isoform X2 n=1 Tax=Lolium perenne TaxID=4522 RepID=UPI0021F50474|nr:MEIOTIC F-BOX protein MOF-like isoform X2 [Lolium perenne]